MADPRRMRCIICGFELESRHCKDVCPNCGATFDCSDPPIYLEDEPESEVHPVSEE